jgi:chemotaxis regulatin CheY-phosphate phosphatase CheZ
MENKRVLILANCFGNVAQNTLRIGAVVNLQCKYYRTVINPLEILLSMDKEEQTADVLKQVMITEIEKADLVLIMKCAYDHEFTTKMTYYAEANKPTIYIK